MDNDQSFPKYQWSKFLDPKHEEQLVVRENDFNEFKEAVVNATDYLDKIKKINALDATTQAQNSDIESRVVEAPICGIHKVPASYHPAGISRTTGKAYNGFWSCPMKNADGTFCTFKFK